MEADPTIDYICNNNSPFTMYLLFLSIIIYFFFSFAFAVK